MTPPRRRIAKSTISHQRVLDAAARLFRERGHTGTTLRAIAAEVQLARLFILGGLNWTVEWFKPERQPLSEVVEEFTRFVVDGLAAPCVK